MARSLQPNDSYQALTDCLLALMPPQILKCLFFITFHLHMFRSLHDGSYASPGESVSCLGVFILLLMLTVMIQAYQAWLGFYKGSMKLIRMDAAELVQTANDFASIMGTPATLIEV